MGRPKGSKNKPKPVAQIPAPPVPEPPKVEAPPRKVRKTKEPVLVPAPVIEKRTRVRKPKAPTTGKITVTEVSNVPAEIDLEKADSGFYPLNMSNFVFTEHRILKIADYVIFHMPADHQAALRKEALANNVDFRIYVVKKMLKSVGFKPTDIEAVVKEIIEYRVANKPEQLYLKYKKR